MRFSIDDKIVDTDNAKHDWDESTEFDGNNHISLATGSQWDHETLYLSKLDRFYIVRTSQRQGTRDCAWFVSDEDAIRWLLINKYAVETCEIPASVNVAAILEEITE